jgi:hypothetical protein
MPSAERNGTGELCTAHWRIAHWERALPAPDLRSERIWTMPEVNEEESADALDALWGLAAPSLGSGAAGAADTGPCERWRTDPDRDRRLWALADGALDEEAERAEWDHVRGCARCLAAMKRILGGIEAAQGQSRWSPTQVEALLRRAAAAAPSPTEEALAAARDLVLRLAEKGLSLLAGTGELVPVTVRVREPAVGAGERVLRVRWDRPWGRLVVDAEQTGPDQCDLIFTVRPGSGLGAPERLRLDWCTADGRPLESQHVEAEQVRLSEVVCGRYLVVIVAGGKEIDRLRFDLEGLASRRA